jgi:hypothetical protein
MTWLLVVSCAAAALFAVLWLSARLRIAAAEEAAAAAQAWADVYRRRWRRERREKFTLRDRVNAAWSAAAQVADEVFAEDAAKVVESVCGATPVIAGPPLTEPTPTQVDALAADLYADFYRES